MNDLSDLSFSSDLSDMGFGSINAAHADNCTQCSVCITSCPTYQATNDFDQSPMGRIRILRQSVEETSVEQKQALESCLHCFNCETVCPSQVDYRRLIVDGYERLGLPEQQASQVRALQHYVAHPLQRSFYNRLAYFLAKFSALFSWLLNPLSQTFLFRLKNASPIVPMQHSDLKTVLFPGCLSDLVQSESVNDAIRVLESLDINFVVERKRCCGALHRHSGQSSTAMEMALGNIEYYEQFNVDHIITLPSACGDSLSHYSHWLSADENKPEFAQQFSSKVSDICSFLYQHDWQPRPSASEKTRRVLLHLPCSVSPDYEHQLCTLIDKIPDCHYEVIQSPFACCGAGGTHVFTHPDLAEQMINPILDHVASYQPDMIISSNIGCSLHLESALMSRQIQIPVTHPITLLKDFC